MSGNDRAGPRARKNALEMTLKLKVIEGDEEEH
jgi:hypothetical protein